MSNLPPNPPAPTPPNATDLNLGSGARLLLGLVAGVLATHGVIAQADTAQFVEVGLAVFVAVGAVWSFVSHNAAHRATVVAALNAKPPAVPAS